MVQQVADSKYRLFAVVCLLLFFVHVMIFEIPGLAYNYDIDSATINSKSNLFEKVIASSISLNESADDITNVFQFNHTNYTMTFTVSNHSLPLCNMTPSTLVGPIRVFFDAPPLQQIENVYAPNLHAGGHGIPAECRARHRVAIIVPYRDRPNHLRILLHNLHALLQKQQYDYSIFVIEQVANQTFNRGKLMNVGYDVASQLYPWQCFIFHDVDLLPEDDRNLYSCPVQPRHMSVAIDKFHYRLPYKDIFGGISAFTKKQIVAINGFSNDFWGWGGEDDDLATRTITAGYSISRYPPEIARYKMIKHVQESSNPINKCRYKLMKRTKQRWRRDGLNSLRYRLVDISLQRLYTRVHVDLLEHESREELLREFATCR